MSDDQSSIEKSKLWGGRFDEPTDQFVQKFTASVGFDKRLAMVDIQGSIAHAEMLSATNIISSEEATLIVQGLNQIRNKIANGEFEWSTELEDVHMNIESALIADIGPTAKKLHTGRSRNDQVATDLRLYLRATLDQIQIETRRLQYVLLELAEKHYATIMPGFTHLQSAQPITFGHHLMAWYEMLLRDADRFADCRDRLNQSPLGAAALAGTTFPIDRQLTAQKLGFSQPCSNSLDAVSDRDFAIEFVAAAALTLIHMSRWSEELILWSSAQFQFVELPDSFCTGSSIMPQKKNPDVPELIRGKAARIQGHWITLTTLMKAQPLAYNKDNQEDKEPVFDTIDTLFDCIKAFADMLPNLQVNRPKMLKDASHGYATATDLADYLVRAGIAFRDAHKIVGETVSYALSQKKELDQLSLQELQSLHPAMKPDVFNILGVEGSVAARNHLGGTAPNQVLSAIQQAKAKLNPPATSGGA
ncbi:MAG TPA: argininosuccinate lyase [Gammaproteobacteria bacterium]|nr:argininosuccinate lyase [Gammaproteobacteria bacterium]